jgi:hypothetical protein
MFGGKKVRTTPSHDQWSQEERRQSQQPEDDPDAAH